MSGGDVGARFQQDPYAEVWISISPPHTIRQTSVRPFIYIEEI